MREVEDHPREALSAQLFDLLEPRSVHAEQYLNAETSQRLQVRCSQLVFLLDLLLRLERSSNDWSPHTT
eukprot:CAMPEP_0194496974 /NCGR_PEP_ID=MMETSP0253-20130528/14072_1 /TAXON_ID=2966 /ORGANISM="Noctiluca scintillans" /LENGTH=68 /DNA_ID=CAMNT_0039338435 /DNA_START=479 /DNA_END=685 /DNA_ORIENTATION=+